MNNAGAQHRAPLTEFTDAGWHRLLDTNVSSAFLAGPASGFVNGQVLYVDGGMLSVL